MDKLQPLIKHRYWICFGLATIFVVTAWFLASGQLAAEIDARTASVKGSFDKSGQGKDQPNQKWVEEAKKRNEADANAYKNAAKSLRERQISARQWPELIREEMKGIAYQEQIQNQLTREKWAANYKDEVESLLEIVKPWREGKGLVVVDSNRITHRPYNAWRTKNPQSREIWDAQEDIWLLRALLTSIATANGTAERITESSVREIYRLHLRGGDREAAGASSGGGMSGMGGMGGAMSGESGGGMSPMAGGLSGPPGMAGGGMGEGGIGGGVSTSHPGSSFEGSAGSDILAEEFGAVAGAGGGMGGMGGEGGKGGGPGMLSMGSMGSGAMAPGGGMPGGGAAAAPAEEDRYVDEVPESYKTRAFLLDVLVRDDRVPDLLAALTDSDFPVEIVRVEITAVGGGGSAAAGGMSGLGGEGGLGEMSGLSGMSGMGSMPDLGGYPVAGGGSKGLTGPPSGGALGSPGLGLSGSGAMVGPAGGQYGQEEGSGLSGGFPGGAAYGTQNQKDAETLRIAMSDDSLVTLRIGGLMTLYQSAEEAKSAEETEAAAATETTNAAPPSNTAPADPAVNPADPSARQPTDPSSTSPPADPNAPAAPASPDSPASTNPTPPGSPASPADPATPAGTDPSGTPSTPPADSPAAPANPAPPAGDSSPAAAPGTAPNPPAGAPGQ